jgi:hypothetical protein
MIMDRITKETEEKLKKQLTEMIISSKEKLIKETFEQLKNENVSEETLEQIKKEFEKDADKKLMLVPQAVKEMMEKAREEGEKQGIQYMQN